MFPLNALNHMSNEDQYIAEGQNKVSGKVFFPLSLSLIFLSCVFHKFARGIFSTVCKLTTEGKGNIWAWLRINQRE